MAVKNFRVPGAFRAIAAGLIAVGILSACETSSVYENRYARYYDACDQRAGICYANCSDLSEPGKSQCQSSCSTEVDQCFADVRDRIAYDSEIRSTYTPIPYYGRYGYYRPGYGYYYGPYSYPYGYSGSRYGYGYGYDYDKYDRNRGRRDGKRDDRYDDGRRDRDDDRNRNALDDRLVGGKVVKPGVGGYFPGQPRERDTRQPEPPKPQPQPPRPVKRDRVPEVQSSGRDEIRPTNKK